VYDLIFQSTELADHQGKIQAIFINRSQTATLLFRDALDPDPIDVPFSTKREREKKKQLIFLRQYRLPLIVS
jgi:hypothetical protein